MFVKFSNKSERSLIALSWFYFKYFKDTDLQLHSMLQQITATALLTDFRFVVFYWYSFIANCIVSFVNN